ncbi:hypothetical protein BN7_4343 [Wickerhamomyces ciferrii]|uniref:Uncharacterized protein n=1 Tax=Wickerhamomyces ciferrii (strain ATCC 14091 / BCRC 22168 / CBS 111 / JCM 3599 / NBRC 0793 / NRRL Y-1031 F-60-10) TaxID=1206466 RepID=K0KHW3_WICCF|nr:uncharacterized protein BN7_4343 [Wickerhamomyces ciferrii]CCH44775.1 hypothetical protein BN7_4343 [Wickerhamomyces ciferrii]
MFNRSLSRSKTINRSQISDPKMISTSSAINSSQKNNQSSNSPKLIKQSSFSSIYTSNNNNIEKSSIPRTTPSTTAVILITKFDFKSEHSNELTVGVGEALKLIERKGNGWILVKPIGRISQPGLIPASYVRIVRLGNLMDENVDNKFNQDWLASAGPLEDPLVPSTPITKEDPEDPKSSIPSNIIPPKQSISRSSTQSDQEQHFSFQSSSSNSSSRPSSPNSITSTSSNLTNQKTLQEPASSSSSQVQDVIPISALVKNVSCYNGRYWYRIDVQLNNGKKRHLCRYYQDFYKLHCMIVEKLRNDSIPESIQDENCSKLPNLPDPIPRPDLETLSSILLQRVQSLNVYIFKIVQNKFKLSYYDILQKWCLPKIGDLESDPSNPISNEAVETLLQPIPIGLNKNGSKPSLKIQTSVTPPLPVPELPPNSFLSKNNSITSISPLSSPISQSIPVWSSPTTSTRSRSDSISGTPRTSNVKKSSISSNTTTSRKQSLNDDHDNWLSSPTEPLFMNKDSRDKFVNKRNESISSLNSSNSSNSNEQQALQQQQQPEVIKIKIYYNNDIFALKFDKKGSNLKDLKKSISKRLECELNSIKLYYKNSSKNYFSPLVDEFDLHVAMGQSKVSIKVHLW